MHRGSLPAPDEAENHLMAGLDPAISSRAKFAIIYVTNAELEILKEKLSFDLLPLGYCGAKCQSNFVNLFLWLGRIG